MSVMVRDALAWEGSERATGEMRDRRACGGTGSTWPGVYVHAGVSLGPCGDWDRRIYLH